MSPSRLLPLIAALVLLSAPLGLPVIGATHADHQPHIAKLLIDGRWQVPDLAPPSPTPLREPSLTQISADPEPWIQLVYSAYDGSDWDLKKVVITEGPNKGRGYSYVNLTENGFDDAGPRLSPDGEKVAFYADYHGVYNIYLVDYAGGAPVQLTASPADILPVWSPDGSRIAFASKRDGDWNIYVMNRDGSGQVRLTSDPADDLSPSWSPDGTTIAWMRASGDSGAIWQMGADGSGQRAITAPLRYLENPSWSPDGSLLAFDYDADGDGYNRPALIAPDGSGLRALAINSYFNLPFPYDIIVYGWSPEGERVMATGVEYGPGYIDTSFNMRITLNNGNALRMTSGRYEDSPDARSTDRSPPITRMEPAPLYTRAGPISIQVAGADIGPAGLASYDLQYRVGSGAWTDWESRLFTNTAVYTGTAGATVSYRVRGRDYAGNLESWRAVGDAQTTFFTYNLSGRLTDARGHPADAVLQLTPASIGGVMVAPQGDYSTRLSVSGAHSAAVSAPGQSAPPATILSMDRDRAFDAMLLPADNLVSNGDFESAGLPSWTAAGSLAAPRRVDGGFTGAGAAQIGLSCTDACLSDAEMLPEGVGYFSPYLVVAPDSRQHLIYLDIPGVFGSLFYQTRLPGDAWSAPEQLGAAQEGSMAVDSLGRLHVVMLNAQNVLVYRSRSVAGVWSSPQSLYTADEAPQLFVDASDRLFLYFTCGGRLGCPDAVGSYLRVLTPGQGWGPLHSLDLRNDSITSSPDGRIFVSWHEPDKGWFLARLGPDGALSSTVQLLGPIERFGFPTQPAIAIDPRGVVHVAWRHNTSSIYYATCLPGELCAPPVSIPGASGAIVLRSDNQGILHLLIQYEGGASDPSRPFSAVYRRLSPGGAWTQPAMLSQIRYADVGMSVDLQGRAHIVIQGTYWHTRNAATAGESQISQTVSIPAGMHRPTLAFAYTTSGLGPGSDSRVVATVSAGADPATEVFFSTLSGGWQTAWVDMSAYAGQTVTLNFRVQQAAGDAQVTLTLDDVSLGSWRTPVIDSVEPAAISALMPTILTIHGDNFIGTPQVLLGQTALRGVTVVDNQTLRVTVPAGASPGTSRLSVMNPAGQRSSRPISVGSVVYLPVLRR